MCQNTSIRQSIAKIYQSYYSMGENRLCRFIYVNIEIILHCKTFHIYFILSVSWLALEYLWRHISLNKYQIKTENKSWAGRYYITKLEGMENPSFEGYSNLCTCAKAKIVFHSPCFSFDNCGVVRHTIRKMSYNTLNINLPEQMQRNYQRYQLKYLKTRNVLFWSFYQSRSLNETSGT